MRASLTAEFQAVIDEQPLNLAAAALVIARLEYPRLDPRPWLDRLDALGRRAADIVRKPARASVRTRIARLNALLFDQEGFAGNRAHYDDFRNSLLNVVLDRRLGIPITLALVYMEVAQRAGVDVRGVSFPGHFLLSVPQHGADLILDPFAAGRELDEADCRALLVRSAGDDSGYNSGLLRPCTPKHLLVRMLNNLKRTYIELQSFPQAHRVCDMVLAADPTLISELRDRGLLAYQLDNYPAALRDLESYLRLTTHLDADPEEKEEIFQHLKVLRRRVASLN